MESETEIYYRTEEKKLDEGWMRYVDHMLSSGHLASAAIIGRDGTTWAEKNLTVCISY
jgi:hypothetical protein